MAAQDEFSRSKYTLVLTLLYRDTSTNEHTHTLVYILSRKPHKHKVCGTCTVYTQGLDLLQESAIIIVLIVLINRG